ncbi:WG repeat-containing protein [Aquiflexum gelatinilyticum]|uniref:WG repeat-containing protein n=1 Tax=Aquiflexum gelatinilyticum TaxID=2961943 RepID=A0A9X2P7E4_9BACT|nr:WG repeat-containing protein [Aquiflexum gelatinilyticum]MCR9017453.1 WG repeat-containing protein [Aquiflexum gelatinilyticum]
MKLKIYWTVPLYLIFVTITAETVKSQTYEVFDQNLKLKSRIEFDQISILGESVRISTSNNQLKLLSKEYKPFVDLKAISVYKYEQPWIVVESPNGKGAFHEYGEEIFAPEYDEIQILYTRLLARKGNKYWIYYHSSRKTEYLGVFLEAKLAMNGQVIAKNPEGYYLPISETPDKQYEHLQEVNESFLISKESTGYGLINRDGDYILDPIIDHMVYLDGDYFYAFDGKQYMLVRCLEERADIKYTSYHKITLEDGMLLEYIHGKLRRVMDNDGILLDQVGMEKVSDVGSKHYNVWLRDNKLGLLGPNGWEVSPISEVDLILQGSESLYPAKKSGAFGFIDKSGNWVVENRFEEVRKFKEGIAAFMLNGNWGYINNKGTIILAAEYEHVSDFNKGKAIVKREGRYLLVGKDGLPILEKTFDRISLAADSYFITENDEKFGLISPEGKEIVEPKFEELRREDLNKILVRLGDKYGILDENGDYILPVYYKSIVFDVGTNQILAEDDYQFAPLEPIENINNKKKKGT